MFPHRHLYLRIFVSITVSSNIIICYLVNILITFVGYQMPGFSELKLKKIFGHGSQ